MKKIKHAYRLLFSLTLFLLAGILVGRSYVSLSAGEQKSTMLEPDSIQAVGGIPMYTDRATMIIVGKVKTVVDHPNDTNIPYTRSVLDAVVEVNSVLKGDPQIREVTVKMIGGQEGMVSSGEGFITLSPEENVLLFLVQDSDGDTVVLGDSYGKYSIDRSGKAIGADGLKLDLIELKNQIADALSSEQKL